MERASTTRSVAVTLTSDELQLAAFAGVMRQLQAMARGASHTHTSERIPDRWGAHVEGAAGELAVAKVLGRHWSGIGTVGDVDIAGGVQVRTRAEHRFDLIVHPDDANEECFVLVTGRAPRFELRGWMLGREAKQTRFWKDPAGGRPAYFVPASALHPLELLMLDTIPF